MKKEYFWFLIFILAAAVVTGSTLGILANFEYISKQSQIRQQEMKAVEANPNEHSSLPNQVQASNNKPGSADTTPQLAANGATDTTVMVVSQTEQFEIDAMLNAVESSNNKDYSTRVRSFQERNALPITGIMDSQTLNTLINQVTIQKSIQRLND